MIKQDEEIILTEEQQKVFEEVISALLKEEKRIIINGAAGTGKTTLTNFIASYYANKKGAWDDSLIWVTAPTNKALSVIQKKIKPHKSITFATIHSALKLKRVVYSTINKVVFKPTRSRTAAFNRCTLAIIDECSMLNSEILDYLEDFSFPIIFVGDSAQLNPVGEIETPIFNKELPTFTLQEIVRQGKGNPIINLSRDLKGIWKRQEVLIENKGYLYNNNKAQLIENLAEINGTDELKYLAWTNADVEKMNTLVRNKLYARPKKVEEGESIIFMSPYKDYWTNQEIKVVSVEIKEKPFYYPNEKTTFPNDTWLNPSFETFKVYIINEHINILHEDDEMKYLMAVKSLSTKCKSENWDWKGYYYFIEQFASISYNHALTVHRSQGSTFKQVIVNIGNIHLNRNVLEKERLLYTAVTRASDLLILSNVPQ